MKLPILEATREFYYYLCRFEMSISSETYEVIESVSQTELMEECIEII